MATVTKTAVTKWLRAWPQLGGPSQQWMTVLIIILIKSSSIIIVEVIIVSVLART